MSLLTYLHSRLPASVIRYGLLAKALYFPSAWLRWMGVIGLGLALVASFGYFLTKWIPLAVVAGLGDMCIAISLMVGALVLPSQMTSINSSRQFAFLPVRLASLLLLIAFCISVPASMVAVLLFFDKAASLPLFLCVLVLLSALMALSVFLSAKMPMGQSFIFMFFWTLKPVAQALLSLQVALLLVILGAVWILFCTWWLRWRPAYHHANVFGLTSQDRLRLHVQQYQATGVKKYAGWLATGQIWVGGKPYSALGSLLIGSSDGHYALLKKAFMNLGVFVGILAFLNFINDKQSNAENISFIFFFMIYLTSSWAILMVVCKNLQRAWLAFMGARAEFLAAVEWHCARVIFYSFAPLMVLHLLASVIASNLFFNWSFAVFLAIYSVILILVAFYLTLIVYGRYGYTLGWFGFLGFCLMSLGAAGALFIVHYWSSGVLVILQVATAVIAALTFVALLLRRYLQRRWLSLDLQRVSF